MRYVHVILALICLLAVNFLMYSCGDVRTVGTLNRISIEKSDFADDYFGTIKATVDYYETNHGVCQRFTEVRFTSVHFFNCGGVTAVGCHRNSVPFADIEVAIKGRNVCPIMETLIHELRHACEGISDCYEDPNCWSYEQARMTYFICGEILVDHSNQP